MNHLFNVTDLFLYLLSFPEHPSSAVRCCALFRGSLASVHSPSVFISPLQASPHMAAQSYCARRTRCPWVYESLGKVWQPLQLSSGSWAQWTGLNFLLMLSPERPWAHTAVPFLTDDGGKKCSQKMLYFPFTQYMLEWKGMGIWSWWVFQYLHILYIFLKHTSINIENIT